MHYRDQMLGGALRQRARQRARHNYPTWHYGMDAIMSCRDGMGNRGY